MTNHALAVAAILFLAVLGQEQAGRVATIADDRQVEAEGGPIRMVEQPAFPADARGRPFALMADLDRKPPPPNRPIRLGEVPIPKGDRP